MPVQFHYDQPGFRLRELQRVRRWLAAVGRRENTAIRHLDYVFTTDKHILFLNKTFLNHNYRTDVLTFQYSDPGAAVAAEVYISVARVRLNARRHGEPFARELRRVMVHALLHCLGYKDETPQARAQMRRLEDHYLQQFVRKKR